MIKEDVRYRYIHIIAALFLIVGMAMQFVMTYRLAMLHEQANINLKTQIAHEKILFELYDAYEIVDQMKYFVTDHLSNPEKMLRGTRHLLNLYPNCFTVAVSFPENFYPEKGKWFRPCSYRLKDSIKSIITGSSNFDYFQRDWYKGALDSGNKGYWSKPYWSEAIDKTIFTHSNNVVDKNGNLICIISVDFRLEWMQQLLEQFKPFDEAVCVIYSSDGTVLTSNDNQIGHVPSQLTKDHWLLSRQTLDPIDIEMIIAVPRWLIWKGILWRIIWPFIVFVLGIVVISIHIRRIFREQQEFARLETEKEIISHELKIAHDIQMNILRHDFPKDEDVTIYADLLPMRDVGGDLYDFHRQGDYLWFIIGDVTGKGMPAAMFMSATVNLFRSALGHQTSPKTITEEMNAVLSDNNPSLTFVTTFIGRLHIPSGQLVYCNAAHVRPVVKSRDGSVKRIEMVPNIPLGYEGKFKYVEEGCMLGTDELLVLYTDGVTEARDVEGMRMGEQKWMNRVAQESDLLESVKQYVGEAEPTDDITLMTIRKKSAMQPVLQCVPNHIDNWPLLRRTLHEYGVCIGIEKHLLKKLEVALEEAVINIINYSHATEIALRLQSSIVNDQRSMINITLTDDGISFDPTSSETDTSKAIEERQIGGMGINLLRQITDELHYQRTDERNQLTIIKYI